MTEELCELCRSHCTGAVKCGRLHWAEYDAKLGEIMC
jgi:hypothetical protein